MGTPSTIDARDQAQTAIRLAIIDPLGLTDMLRAYSDDSRRRLAWAVAVELGRAGVFCSPPNILAAWTELLGPRSEHGT